MAVTGLVPGNRSRGKPAMARIANTSQQIGLRGSEMVQTACVDIFHAIVIDEGLRQAQTERTSSNVNNEHAFRQHIKNDESLLKNVFSF